MSPDQESSYYEIALTNRQVMTIFVVLLTCLVAAFLSGVWIGQRGGAEEALLASTGEAPGEVAAAEMAELRFFSDPPSLPAGGTAGDRPAPRRPADAEAEERPAERPQPRREEPAAPAARNPPAAEPRPAAPAPPAETVGSRPVIQVFSTADVGQARRLIQRLGAGGYPAFLLQESLQGQTMYRVRVGPYREQGEAERIADKLRREFRLDTWITTQQPG